ncbi:MAG: hypothetical protein IGS03_03075 [Candidatus Sericytochromatia bacterium]|nr:hypothetical protein [Candidatus Sericytochromatia bacterium]
MSEHKTLPGAQRRNFWLFLMVGVLDLLIGLSVSVYIGLSQSWLLAMILALGFFMSANLMFYFALQKLKA